MNLLESLLMLVQPMSESILPIVAQQAQGLQLYRPFWLDQAVWVMVGLVLVCLVLIVLVWIHWQRDMNRQKDNERRMIELLESIDRRLAERSRDNNP